MIITLPHLIVFILLLSFCGICYVIYLLRIILEYVECTFDMSVNIEEATKKEDTDEDFLSAN